jgi:hypothetical protein
MAQAGFTPITIYSSSTATNVPLAANLAQGELAINTADGKLFYEDSSGVVQVIATKAGANGTVTSVAMTVPSFLSVTGSPITSSGTLAITLSGTALPVLNGGTGVTTSTGTGNVVLSTSPTLVTPVLGTPTSGDFSTGTFTWPTFAIANGGTGQTTAAAAFNALSPITTTGDLILGNGVNSATRIAIGANNTVLTSDGTTASWVAAASAGVASFSGSTTGLTPNTATTGAITLGGTLAVANGGTGVTSSTGTTSVVLSTAPTITGLVSAAGTTTVAPIRLTSGTNLTSATAGSFEYNGTIQTFTPLGTQRGIIPNEQYFRLNSTVVGANALGQQSIFGVGVTLSANTVYEYEIVFGLSKSAGTSGHTIAFGFGGTATRNNNVFYVQNSSGTTASNNSYNLSSSATTASNTGFNSSTFAFFTVTSLTSVASVSYGFLVKGTVSINDGGTFIPQYQLSFAPGGAYTTSIGSYVRIKPIGVSGANTSVGTWA